VPLMLVPLMLAPGALNLNQGRNSEISTIRLAPPAA